MTLLVIDPDTPQRYLEVRGELEEIVADPEGAFFVRLGQRYGDPDQEPPPDKADRVILVMRVRRATRH
jgi:hypothetical protein